MKGWIFAREEIAIRMVLIAGAAMVLAVGLCRNASAHLGGHTGYASISIERQQVRYSLQLSAVSLPPALADQMKLGKPGLLPDLNPLLAAIGRQIKLTNAGRVCQAGPGFVTPPPPDVASITLVVDFVCTDRVSQLTIVDDLPDVLGTDYHTLARIDWPGGSDQFAFTPETRSYTVKVGTTGAQATGSESFFLLGVQHILTGWDHLLFLLCLLLLGNGFWSLLKIVTAFTIAHSITLAAAALGVVVPPSRLIESTIALSIAYVAAENVFLRDRSASKRWMVAFAFGLVHGFGFSSVLREIGLPKEGLVWSLLGFNLGVEAGQAIVVAAAMPLLLRLRRASWEPRMVKGLSAFVLAVGVGLFFQRAFF
ncbi:MAG TPA: HupE/UreJ family protein [Burkholderiales bacterium]|nr:HupE/UreJ family protein [Burkholderiales bacterium]